MELGLKPVRGGALAKLERTTKNVVFHVQSMDLIYHKTNLQVIFNHSKNRADAKEDTEKASSNFYWQLSRSKVIWQLICHIKNFNLMYNMQKEDTEKASPNAGMASRFVEIIFIMVLWFFTCYFGAPFANLLPSLVEIIR